MLFILLLSLVSLGNCQSLPQFEHLGFDLSNNSYIYSIDIGYGDGALNCVTNSSVNCCNNTDVGGWRDESGTPVYQGADGTTCLYVTRGDGVISLHRNCSDHTPGLWRCDIPDSSGEMQNLYIYISNRVSSHGELNYHVTFYYTKLQDNWSCCLQTSLYTLSPMQVFLNSLSPAVLMEDLPQLSSGQ